MKEKLQQLEKEINETLGNARTPKQLEEARIKYIGRKGVLTEMIKAMKDAPAEERPYAGKKINELKRAIEEKIKAGAKAGLKPLDKEAKHKIDFSLPGSRYEIGSRHPLSQIIDEICNVFLGFGFRIVEGPEIETEYYNFTALNIPEDHPSRETFHTFFLDLPSQQHKKDKSDHRVLLRSQTSQ